MYSKSKIEKFIKEAPILQEIIDLKPVSWINPSKKPMKEMPTFPIKKEDMLAAEKLWHRFAPFFEKAFPETAATDGILESPLKEIPKMKALLNAGYPQFKGSLYLKCDNALPIAGSIKARGGFFEVLHYAEQLALKAGILKEEDNYDIFTSDNFKQLIGKYNVGDDSTGNLGSSIGIISAKLGFKVRV